ncbi:MAG: hypothetical protein D6753_04020 [Planctomycetota bacterium]|nr:MAG: hypothetical protein D6753_04020 [Planctomycetota bacterium]
MQIASTSLSYTYTKSNGKEKTKTVKINSPVSSSGPAESPSSETQSTSGSSGTSDGSGAAGSGTTPDAENNQTSSSGNDAKLQSVEDTAKRYQILVNLVLDGQALSANENKDGIELSAADHTITLSKEDLLRDSELRQIVRQKITEQLRSVALDLSGFKLDLSSVFQPKNDRKPGEASANPSSLIDLALAKLLSQRQHLDVEA